MPFCRYSGAFSHTGSNFSGYSEARIARPAAAKAIPRGRRRVMTNAAPTPIEPNTIAFFQFCMVHLKRCAARQRNGLEQLRRLMLYAECFLMQRFIVSEMSEDGLRTAQGAGQESC